MLFNQWSSGQTISKITNLTAGTYTLTLTDANGCVETTTYTVNSPTPIQLNLVATGLDCNSGNNGGQIVANATGGTLPYTYTWSTRGTTDTLSNLSVGTYCLTLTDANGCSLTACDSIVPAPNPLTIRKTASNNNVAPNSTFNYTIDVTNNCQSSVNVQVIDTLPVGLQLLSVGGLTYDPTTRILSTTTLLGGGVTQTFDISVRVIGMARCRRNFRYWNTATALVINRPNTLVLDSVGVRVRDTAAINCAPVITNAVNFSTAIQAGTLLPFTAATTTSQTVVIAGTWIVDNPYSFVNSTIYMQPGAEIIVPNGSSLNLDNTTVRGGCNGCMWHRILIEDGGGILTSNGTNIFDAQYGIQANSGSLLKQITNTTFSGNFIGIYIPPNPKGNVVGIGAFRENTFTSRNIPSNFVGMQGTPMLDSRQNTILVSPTAATPTFLKPGLAGIVAWNTGAINLNDATATNDFRRLVAGIVLFRSNLKTNSCHFNQITECYACYPPTLEFHGCGIYLQTKGGNHSVEFEGTLNNPNQTLTSFNRCDVGVSSRGGHTRVIWADFNRMARFGIRGISCFNSTISIKSNSMNRLEGVGIGLFDNGFGTDVLIDGNNIVVNNTTTANQFRAGIQLTSNPAFPYSLQVSGNDILPRDGQFGITITGFRPDKAAVIVDNDITLNGTTANRAGIGVFDSEINLSCNRIEGNRRNLRNARNFGIVGSIARGGTWECNVLDNMTTGVFFDGLNDIDFKGNRFDRHETGLLISSSAVIGRQTDQGNRWTGNANEDAMNFNNIGVQASEFIVDGQANLIPNNFGVSLAPNWFRIQPGGNTFDCNAPLQICNSPLLARANNNASNFNSLSTLDTAIVNGDTLSSSYNLTVSYTGQRNLFNNLINSNTPTSGIFQSFINTCQNSCIGHFDAISQQVSDAFEMNTTDSILLDSLNQVCHHYSDTLVSLDSILGINFTNSLASQRKLLAIDFANTLEQSELLIQQIQIQQQADITPICNINSGFVTAALHEELEKQVNTIYMNTLAQGINNFNNTQLNTLRLIAAYCPAEGGAAVHQAQALLSMVENVDFLNFDCINEQAKIVNDNLSNNTLELLVVELYPNPTEKDLTISSNQILMGSTTIEIYNTVGQQILVTDNFENFKSTTIDVNTLTDGVYIMRLKNGDQLITKPFIVIK